MPSSEAAPLQCAGATVYSALIDVVKSGTRVGVLGIGGLGHLAIQFAAKLGAEVVVFSTSAQKEEEARKFGASEFYLLSKPESLTQPIDILVLTGHKYPDFSTFLTKDILARTGTVVPLTASAENMDLPALAMFFGGYNIHSSLVASRKVHSDMLKFAAFHKIRPAIEEFKMNEEGWAKALKRLTSGQVRYRAVLVNE
jgi:D-arabinose 1-dehydrogenase-like Zn-dependent alcohol dehydrogenase